VAVDFPGTQDNHGTGIACNGSFSWRYTPNAKKKTFPHSNDLYSSPNASILLKWTMMYGHVVCMDRL
jgi:hypothetical protein